VTDVGAISSLGGMVAAFDGVNQLIPFLSKKKGHS
jgi:hypothetical protein